MKLCSTCIYGSMYELQKPCVVYREDCRLYERSNMQREKGTVEINNIPEKHSKYVVCRLLDGQLWFYTSWSDKDKAEAAAAEFENGIVVEVTDEV